MTTRRAKGMLITLSGIDGTGKSAMVGCIRDTLLSKWGTPSRYVWCKFGDHPFSRLKIAQRAKRRPAASPPEPHHTRRAPSLPLRVYGSLLLILHMAQIALSVRRPLKRGEVVVCDRYIFDTIVDLAHDLHCPIARAEKLCGARWIPQPDVRFLLDLPGEIAFARKDDSYSAARLEERRALYLSIAPAHRLTMVDARQPFDQVARQITRAVEARYAQGIAQ